MPTAMFLQSFLRWILCLALLISAPGAAGQWGVVAPAEEGNRAESPVGDASGNGQEGETTAATVCRNAGGRAVEARFLETNDASLGTPRSGYSATRPDAGALLPPSPLFLRHRSLLC